MSGIVLGTDTFTLAIAIYGAVLSTCLLIWGIYTWRREHSTRITVEAWLAPGAGPHAREMTLCASVRASNRSHFSVKIDDAGLSAGSRDVPFLHSFGDELGKVVEARQTATFVVPASETGLDLTQPVKAYVRTALGERFETPSRQLPQRD